MDGFYILALEEAEVDEQGLGPTYRLVVNKDDPANDGRWYASSPEEALKAMFLATGRTGIHAIVPSEEMRVARYPEWIQ